MNLYLTLYSCPPCDNHMYLTVNTYCERYFNDKKLKKQILLFEAKYI